jgi:hypothetical protein
VSVWLALGAVLAAAAVVVVALPFLREPGLPAAQDRFAEPDARTLELAEERDRSLAALKELEFDHRTGKVSDEDYRALVGPLRQAAAAALRALDAQHVYGDGGKRAANGRIREENEMSRAIVEPPQLPEPSPVPSEPPQPVTVPEPSPVPSEPPMPAPMPEPTPEPSPPMPEPPAPGA